MKKLIIFSLLLIVSSATFAQLGYPYTKSQTDALFYKKTVADTTFVKIANADTVDLKLYPKRLETVTNARIDHTGTTNETTLITINVPAERLNKNAVIKFWIVANFTNSATNKVVRLKDQSGAQVWSSGNVTTSSSIQVVPFVALRNSLTSQVYPNNTYFGSNQTSVVGTSSFDAANGLTYTLTAQCAQSASDHIYIESFWVETIKGAE